MSSAVTIIIIKDSDARMPFCNIIQFFLSSAFLIASHAVFRVWSWTPLLMQHLPGLPLHLSPDSGSSISVLTNLVSPGRQISCPKHKSLCSWAMIKRCWSFSSLFHSSCFLWMFYFVFPYHLIFIAHAVMPSQSNRPRKVTEFHCQPVDYTVRKFHENL